MILSQCTVQKHKIRYCSALVTGNFLYTYYSVVTVVILYHYLPFTASCFNITVLLQSNALYLCSATTTRNILYHSSLLGSFKVSVPLVCVAVKDGP